MNLRRVGILIILLGVLLLSACIPKTLVYSGESDNWNIRYEVATIDEESETKAYIKYIGNEPIPEQIEYSIYNQSGTITLNENGLVEINNKCTGYNCAVPNSKQGIESIINWDNKSESILLKIE